MPSSNCAEVEIKFHVDDPSALEARLRELGFQEKTPLTRERNTLYDTPERQLRQRGEILRIRHYGRLCKLTHKAHGVDGRHKVRIERETEVGDGPMLAGIFACLGYQPVFSYEKFRAEWTDGRGEVVLDLTPIGNYAEIEGEPEWIDETARRLGVDDAQFETRSYGRLFLDWCAATGSTARNMSFAECGCREPEPLPRG
jgi:adenylate cyclase class 2